MINIYLSLVIEIYLFFFLLNFMTIFTNLSKSRIVRKKLRLPITKNLFRFLLIQKKGFKRRKIGYHRFRICCVLLYSTGLRLSDIGALNLENITDLATSCSTQIISKKTNCVLPIVISEKNRMYLLRLKPEIFLIFKDLINKTKVSKKDIFRITLSHTKTNSLFNYWFNNQLNFYLYQIFQNNSFFLSQLSLYKSHSFRIGRVTRLLGGKMPIQDVAVLMGHKNIQTTLLYNRFQIFEKRHHSYVSQIEDREVCSNSKLKTLI